MPAESPLRDRLGPGHALIETMRFDPAAGFVRLDRHMARLAASATALGFPFDGAAILDALQAALREAGPSRVRLTLSAEGSARAVATPFAPSRDNAPWRVAIARTRLASGDPLLRHKTTRRDLYKTARAEFSAGEADEVLLLNEAGRVCEGTITNVFLDMGDGILLTPGIGAGLLPGVLRAALIEEGRAREGDVDPAMLRRASALFVGNSLRGLIPARLRRGA